MTEAESDPESANERPIRLKRENGILPIVVCAALAFGNAAWMLVAGFSVLCAVVAVVLSAATVVRIGDYFRDPRWYFELESEHVDGSGRRQRVRPAFPFKPGAERLRSILNWKSMRRKEIAVMTGREPDDLKFACMFCGEGIGRTHWDPCAVVVIPNWEHDEVGSKSVQLFAHALCIARACSPDTPIYVPGFPQPADHSERPAAEDSDEPPDFS